MIVFEYFTGKMPDIEEEIHRKRMEATKKNKQKVKN